MRTHYYSLRSPRLWWARIWVTSDGLITIASDYGHFGYWFGSPGCEIRRFLTGVDPSQHGYMAIKLADGRREYDADGTVRRIREEVVRMRRKQEIDRASARELWDSVTEFELDNDDHRAASWLDEDLVREHMGCDAYGYFSQQIPGSVRGLMRDVWPVFVETLKAELQSEHQHREAFGEMQDMGT